MRLWGKIACSGKDYFIAEGQADFEDYGELSPDTEPLGGDEPGVNQLNYYVATDRKKWGGGGCSIVLTSLLSRVGKLGGTSTGDSSSGAAFTSHKILVHWRAEQESHH